MMKPMSNYYKVQSKKVYALMQEVEDEKYRETVMKKKELDALDAEYVVDSIKQVGSIAIAEYEDVIEKRSSNKRREDPVLETIEDICCDAAPAVINHNKWTLLERPKNWEIIAEYYGQWGKYKTIPAFPDELAYRSERSSDQALRAWLLDFRAKKSFSNINKSAPAYGFDIDQLLFAEIKRRIAAGLPTDDVTLRMILVDILEAHGKSNMWAARFWKRHKLVSRVATLIPANFDALEENYISVAAHMIHQHNIPPDLVYYCFSRC